MAARIARSFLPQQAGLRASFFKEEAPVLTGKAPPSCSSLPLGLPLDLPRPGSSCRQASPALPNEDPAPAGQPAAAFPHSPPPPQLVARRAFSRP